MCENGVTFLTHRVVMTSRTVCKAALQQNGYKVDKRKDIADTLIVFQF